MTYLEKKQIEYLKKQKDALIDSFMGACEEINAQIKDVKNGTWLKEVQNEQCD